MVLRTCQRGGKVIIPAFSVGRTQELVYFLNLMNSQGDLPGLPVFVDSPLAVNATDIFSRHAELFDSETDQFIRERRHPALELPRVELHSQRGGIQGDQRDARPDGDHLGLGDGGIRAHPAPPEEQHRKSAQHGDDRLLAGAGYARAAHGRTPADGEDLRRTLSRCGPRWPPSAVCRRTPARICCSSMRSTRRPRCTRPSWCTAKKRRPARCWKRWPRRKSARSIIRPAGRYSKSNGEHYCCNQ